MSRVATRPSCSLRQNTSRLQPTAGRVSETTSGSGRADQLPDEGEDRGTVATDDAACQPKGLNTLPFLLTEDSSFPQP